MITIKSKREIALMREAGRIVALAHQAVREHIKPGISTLDLDRIAHDVIIQHDALPSFKGYGGFSGSICASMNEVVVHGIPNRNDILSEGDIISIDIGAYYKGYHGDAAKTYPVGTISDEDQQLLNVTEQSLFAGLAHAKPGNHLSDVSHAIYQYATAYGYGVVDQFTGHGIGQKLHEAPEIPNFGDSGCGPILRAGMTLAIEPMINQGSKDVKVLLDHWTTITVDRKKSAHFEHTIVITDDGYDILTTL